MVIGAVNKSPSRLAQHGSWSPHGACHRWRLASGGRRVNGMLVMGKTVFHSHGAPRPSGEHAPHLGSLASCVLAAIISFLAFFCARSRISRTCLGFLYTVALRTSRGSTVHSCTVLYRLFTPYSRELRVNACAVWPEAFTVYL